MSTNTSIIHTVEKSEELVMLEKKSCPYVYNWEWGLLFCRFFFFLFFSLGKLNCRNFNIFFFFPPLKTPHKKLGSCVLANQRQAADQRPDLTGSRRGQCTHQKKQELPNRFCSLFSPAESLKLNTLIMPVISYCSASCLQPGN